MENAPSNSNHCRRFSMAFSPSVKSEKNCWDFGYISMRVEKDDAHRICGIRMSSFQFDPFQLSFCRWKKKPRNSILNGNVRHFAFVHDIHGTPQCTSDELFYQPLKWARFTAHTSDWFDWMMINDNYWFDSNAIRHGHGRHRRIVGLLDNSVFFSRCKFCCRILCSR